YLLTDVYPPFTLDDGDYPVRLAVMPGRLNRLAVLFRFFLLIPCWIVQGVVTYGALTIFMFVTWLIVLITGQMPDAIHQALAAEQVVADIAPVRDVLNNYSTNVQACKDKLSCVQGVDRKVATTLSTFAGQLHGTAMPSQATAANAKLASAVSDTAAIFAKLS